MKVFLVAVMCLSAGNLYGASELESKVAELNKKIEKLEKLIGQLAKQHPQPIPQIHEYAPTSQQSVSPQLAPHPIQQTRRITSSESLPRDSEPHSRHTNRVHLPRTVPFNPNAPLPKGWQRLNLNEQYYIFIVPVEGETLGVSSGASSIPQGELRMDIKSYANPLREGIRTKYAIVVKNSASVSDEQVVLRVQFPQELTPDATSIKSIVPAHVSGNVMQFDPVASLRSGESISFEIPVTVNRAGRGHIRAVLSSNNTPHGIRAVAPIEVIGR